MFWVCVVCGIGSRVVFYLPISDELKVEILHGLFGANKELAIVPNLYKRNTLPVVFVLLLPGEECRLGFREVGDKEVGVWASPPALPRREGA